MPLADLIDEPGRILNSWPTEPMLCPHAPDSFGHLLTIEEVEELIDNECVAARNVVLLKDGTVLERYRYVRGEMPRRGVIREHLDAGGTISLRELQSVKPSLARLQADIQDATGCLVHVNAYMTPPGNQGLKFHYDPYVTLIVQLAGHKTWPLHRPMVENPVVEYGNFLERGFTATERHYLANTVPAESFTLAPGDVFWLPRGFVHSPYTAGDATSLHLTFALKERTHYWAGEQLLDKVLTRALAEPELRAEIPPAELLAGPLSVVKGMREYLAGALLMMSDEEAAELVRRAALEPR